MIAAESLRTTEVPKTAARQETQVSGSWEESDVGLTATIEAVVTGGFDRHNRPQQPEPL
jgi:hypothetical protein